MSLSALKNLNMDRLLELDEAVSLSAESRALSNEFELLDLPVPEWLESASNVLREEIARRTHASALAEMKKVEAELDGLKSTAERKVEAQKRLAALQRKLGMTVGKS